MMMAYAYEGVYRSSYIGEIVEFEQKLWKISCLVNKMNVGILKKSVPVERQSEAILDFLRDQRVGKVDCFVYGDTHKAGIYDAMALPWQSMQEALPVRGETETQRSCLTPT